MPSKRKDTPSDAPSAAKAPSPEVRRVILWLEPDQADLVEAVASLSPIEVTHVGDARGVDAGDLAKRFEAESITDLRAALIAGEADAALICAISRKDAASALDAADVRRACTENGLKILSMTPTSASLLVGAPDRSMDSVRFVPRMQRSPGFRSATEVFETFGTIDMVSIACCSGAAQGALGARLFDAMDVANSILGEPETIDAALRGPRSQAGLHIAPGESLRELRGNMSAHLRGADGRSAALTLTDGAGRWFRGATLLGEGGRIRIDDAGFEWTGPDGKIIDSSRRELSKEEKALDEAIADGAVVICEEIRRLLDPHTSTPEAPIDSTGALAMSEAAMLSARTGQPESPATIRRMARAG